MVGEEGKEESKKWGIGGQPGYRGRAFAVEKAPQPTFSFLFQLLLTFNIRTRDSKAQNAQKGKLRRSDFSGVAVESSRKKETERIRRWGLRYLQRLKSRMRIQKGSRRIKLRSEQ